MLARFRKLRLIAAVGLSLTLVAPAPGKITCYQDDQGVWRIHNQEPAPAGQGAKESAPKVPQEQASPNSSRTREASTTGSIRCYTDAKGVIRITNLGAEPAKSAAAVAPEAAPSVTTTSSEAKKTAPLPPGIVKANSPSTCRPGDKAAASRLTGRLIRYGKVCLTKDAQGRYKIFNLVTEPEDQPLKPSGSSLAREEIEPVIAAAAQRYDLDPALIRAVIKAESNFAVQARSPKGAMGLMQLMPGTASFLGVTNPFCPIENIHGGSRYLRLLLNCFNGNLELALAAYNAGFQRVINAGFQIPGLKETEEFVRRVLQYFQAYRQRQQ